MKKLLALLLAVGVTASVVQAQEVLSQNAVGYVKVDVDQGNLYLLRNDFESVDGAPMTIDNVIGDQLPDNTIVTLFDANSQAYLPPIQRSFFGGWGTGGTNILETGKSFFVRLPDTPPEPSYELFLMGEVPAEEKTQFALPGLNQLGYPYPAETSWTNTVMAQDLPDNTVLSVWDDVAQEWLPPIQKSFFGGWGVAGNALVLEPGEGFFVNSPAGSTLQIDEVKPYTWP